MSATTNMELNKTLRLLKSHLLKGDKDVINKFNSFLNDINLDTINIDLLQYIHKKSTALKRLPKKKELKKDGKYMQIFREFGGIKKIRPFLEKKYSKSELYYLKKK